jgi:hypothetical protein
MTTDSGKPPVITTIRLLLALNGVIWVLLAAAGFMRTGAGGAMVVVYLLALADAAVLFWLGWKIGSRSRWIYVLALAVIAANAVLSITDELGPTDIAILGLNLATLALLLAACSWYYS